jgi:hypothetical protein
MVLAGHTKYHESSLLCFSVTIILIPWVSFAYLIMVYHRTQESFTKRNMQYCKLPHSAQPESLKGHFTKLWMTSVFSSSLWTALLGNFKLLNKWQKQTSVAFG